MDEATKENIGVGLESPKDSKAESRMKPTDMRSKSVNQLKESSQHKNVSRNISQNSYFHPALNTVPEGNQISIIRKCFLRFVI